jgi:ATP-dependent RNA helicase DeaD
MESSAVARSQNVVYVMPHDWASMARFLEPLVERIDESRPELQLVVIAADTESAAALSGAAVRTFAGRPIQIVAATSSTRAARLLKLRPAQMVVGTASTIVELMRTATIKVDGLRQIAVAWADELLTRGEAGALETIMADVPKDAARSFVVGELSSAVEELLERYARRARRVIAPASETTAPTPVEYITTSPRARLNLLRRVLDDIDPPSAVIFAREADSVREIDDLLRAMGYGPDDAVRVGLVAPPDTRLVVLYDLPASREELREAAGAAGRTIAFVQPRQVAALRALAAGGAVRPLTLPDATKRARDDDAKLRAELRATLEDGKFGRALLALEPLLEDWEGSEVAAAALTLLEREREAHRVALASIPAVQRPDAGPMVRLFITIGSRDNARPGDLVGAIANEGGISSAEIGRVDMRESHSVVEVSAGVADTVIERLNGAAIKGRRAVVRRDEQPERGDRGDRGGRGERGERGERGGRPRGPGARGDRGAPGARGDRGAPRERSERGQRPSRPRREDRE